jgi:Tol biopolymer transport system component
MQRSRYVGLLSALGLILLLGCSVVGTTPAVSQIEKPYLGQEPPGLEPEVFAPGIVSLPGYNEYSGTFSPDGSEYYFYRFSEEMPAVLFYSQDVNGEWTAPEQLQLTAAHEAYEPYVTPDNQWLYFAWNNPTPGQNPGLPGYYVSQRMDDGWSEPKYAGLGMFMSGDRAGNLYTTDMSTYLTDGRTFLTKLTVTDGVFTGYDRLDISARYGHQAHPCIAPDGTFLLFDVNSGGHLFVSFRQADGTWGEAIDLVEHGFDRKAGGATISPDGRYLFFSLDGDIWWVDIGVIEKLR